MKKTKRSWLLRGRYNPISHVLVKVHTVTRSRSLIQAARDCRTRIVTARPEPETGYLKLLRCGTWIIIDLQRGALPCFVRVLELSTLNLTTVFESETLFSILRPS